MKLEEILPEIRKGRKAKRNDCLTDLSANDKYLEMSAEDLLADDWELAPEPIRVADYLVPTVSQLYVYDTGIYPTYFRNTYPIGQQPEGSVLVPGSERDAIA
jgi:hypothetical protein